MRGLAVDQANPKKINSEIPFEPNVSTGGRKYEKNVKNK